MKRVPLGILSLLIWFAWSAASPHQVGEEPLEWNALLSYRFGEILTIKGNLAGQELPREVNLILQAGDEAFVQPLKLDGQGYFEYQHDFQQAPLRPFSHVAYWLEGVSQRGTPFATLKKEFYYEDNRFPWKTRRQDLFQVHWRQGDLQFAQTALNVAKEARTSIQQWLPFEMQETIEIYIYDSPGELRQALPVASSSWVGAHADPDLGIILISVSEGFDQRLQMEQQIPHEMMHIALYRYNPEAYPHLPTWLQEGLATAVELYPNPDYYTLLETAHQNQSLLSIVSLCDTFPQEASLAYLAYAESTAFVQYLLSQYGMDPIRRLIEQYAEQVDCQAGFYRIYGVTLEQLEGEWQKAQFGENAKNQALTSLAAWLGLLLFVVFVPLIYSWRLVSGNSIRKEDG